MPDLSAELILTVDGLARGTRSPAYYGFGGPEFMEWLGRKTAEPHRNLFGRRTYEMLDALPEEHRDADFRAMTRTPGAVASRSLEAAAWPGLEVVRDDLLGRVRAMKEDGGPEIRTVGSLSVVGQLVRAGLVDRFRLILCPLVLPATGVEPAFATWPDTRFELLGHTILDGQVIVLDYRPSGPPPG